MSVTNDQFLEAKKQLSCDYDAHLDGQNKKAKLQYEIETLKDKIHALEYNLALTQQRIMQNTQTVQRWLLKNKHPTSTLANGKIIHVPRQKKQNFGPIGPASGAYMTRQAIENSAFKSWLVNPKQNEIAS